MTRSISVIALAAAFVSVTGVPGAATKAAPTAIAIYFPYGTAELTKEALAVLDETAKLTRGYPNSHIIVVGRTDSTGGRANNDRIALARANNTRDALVARSIDPANVTVLSRPSRRAHGATASFIADRRADVVISLNPATL